MKQVKFSKIIKLLKDYYANSAVAEANRMRGAREL